MPDHLSMVEFSSEYHMDIITKINSNAECLTENDVDEWITDELLKCYQSKIDKDARYVYETFGTFADVSKLAFRESARSVLNNATKTFLFKTKLWQNGRDINPYLLFCLKIHKQSSIAKNCSADRICIPICPVCRELGHKSFLIREHKLWRCSYCTSEIDRLTDEISKNNDIAMRKRLKLHQAFALHSRKGYRCPEENCGKFIPFSLNSEYGIACPYLNCDFFGNIQDLEIMSHPAGLSCRNLISLDSQSKDAKDDLPPLNRTFKSHEISSDDKISINETFNKELKILIDVIDAQIRCTKRTGNKGSYMQKLLMHEAYREMCLKNPEEMVSYLVHIKQNSEFPIQSRIFQEYVCLVENALPFMIERGGEKIDILSISDPELGIFRDGISVFDAIVDHNNLIPNNTIETYTGGRKFKNHGPCFIGKIIDIIDKSDNRSIRNNVKRHSFAQIEMDKSIIPGTEVTVSHYRLPSHYEMGSLVFLQRIRKTIVDKVYFRINGSKR